MLDFLRDRGSTAEDKRREALSAYLDNSLSPAERERVDKQLSRDTALRDDLERMRNLKLQMRAMPRRRVPRSFALDPALYGRPKAQPLMQLYPVLRGATALTAVLLIFTLALGAFQGATFGGTASAPTEVAVSEAAVEEAAPVEVPETPAELAAPAVGGETERAAATGETEAPSELAAQEALTGTYSIEAVPLPQGTSLPEMEMATTGVPAADLTLEPTATVQITPAEADTVAETIEEQALPSDENTARDTEPARTNAFGGMLRPLQIGLGVAFLLLFILWLLARRRVRSF